MVPFIILAIARQLRLSERLEVVSVLSCIDRLHQPYSVVVDFEGATVDLQFARPRFDEALSEAELALDHALLQLGEDLFRGVHCLDREGLARAHESHVLVRYYFVNGVVLRGPGETIFQVFHLASVDSIVSDKRAHFEHFSPVCERV